MPAALPRVAVITTGGTIASRRDPETGAVSAVASPDELVAGAPEIAGLAELVLQPWASVNSWNMTPAMMFDLARDVSDVLRQPDIAGAVVTHGTDTVEESGFMADLVVASDKPVVFAVAMRNLSESGADGPRNLADAVRVAVHPASRGRGALLVANGEIHACRYVTKMNTVSPAAFQSPDFGPAGLVHGGQVRYLHPPPVRRTLEARELEEQVHIVKAVSGEDSALLAWLCERGALGIVLEGSGAGNVPGTMLPGIEEALHRGLTVALTTRVPGGFLSPTYGSGGASGGGFDLMRLGVLPADHLPSQKARIALMLALGAALPPREIRALLAGP